MKRPSTAASSTALLASALLLLSACADGMGQSPTQTHTETATETVTVNETATPTTDVSDTSDSGSPTTGGITAPASAFGQEIAGLPEVDPAPYASSRIFPQQPGFQFTGPDGTYCEVYGQPEGVVEEVAAMCTHSGEGDVNAVSVSEGQPATTHHVNRIFAPLEETRVLESGTRLTDGAVSCGIPGGEVAVTCAIGAHGFTVSTEGAETG